MATLYGGAMPDDFVSGEELTATEFNKVKNYWIVDGALPEGSEINDGDVVFVLGDAAVGTADITAITGSGVTHTYGDFVAFEFLTSGTMTCTQGLLNEVLLVGGGGGSGGSSNQTVGAATNSQGGGGGGGGFLSVPDLFVPASTLNVLVGAGGVLDSYITSYGLQGGTSAIEGITYSVGGGGGGNRLLRTGTVGGSGGGNGATTAAGGSAIPGLGNDGGAGTSGGAGGGASAAGTGTLASLAAPSLPGDGLASTITGSSVTYGGGGASGGGSTGGAGGGGASGGPNGPGNPGTDGLGGGAGAAGYSTTGAKVGAFGGSGVVIVKVLADNAANVDKSGWTEVTALMLAEAKKKRELERKAEQLTRVLEEKKLALEEKNEELSGATQMDIEGDLI